MQIEIMGKVINILNFQMKKERRNVVLFLDNATVHPTSLIDMYSNIKIILLCFPSKEYNVTFAAASCWNNSKFQNKVQKLIRYVIACINDNLFASKIAKGVDILQTITWVADARKVSSKRSRTSLQNVLVLTKQEKMKMT